MRVLAGLDAEDIDAIHMVEPESRPFVRRRRRNFDVGELQVVSVSHEKATRLLGYQPRYSWRESDFRSWLETAR